MDETVNTPPNFQPMPPLAPEQRAALRADIQENGVLVPITVDQHGRIIDGNNRAAIAAELGIDCPREVTEVADDDAAMDLAVTLNMARRHLTREQQRAVILTELTRRPGDSDRAIARRVGCSPTTVGTVRKAGVSKLDTPMSREEAESLTAELKASEARVQEGLDAAQAELFALVVAGLRDGIPVTDIVRALIEGQRRMERGNRVSDVGREISMAFNRHVWEPVIDAALLPETADRFAEDRAVLGEGGREQLLDGIVSIGDAWSDRGADR